MASSMPRFGPSMPIDRPSSGLPPYAPEEVQILSRRVKAELRKSMQRVRAFTPRDVRSAASRAIVDRVLEFEPVKAAHAVALFRTIERKAEIETAPLDAALRARGVRVAYPCLVAAETAAESCVDPSSLSAPDAMPFRWVDDPSSFVDGGRGFEEPCADLPFVEADALDVIVVPGLAFDPRGYRLGYGAGYYDRSLPAWPRACTVGVAFEHQVLMEIPKAEHDVPVQWIVTEKRVLRAEGS